MPLTVEDEIYLRDFLNDIDGGLLPLTTISGSQSLDFGVILDGETAPLQFALIGALAGAAIAVGPPATLEAGLTATAIVPALNVVEVRLTYLSSGAGPTSINPAVGIYKVTVFIP